MKSLHKKEPLEEIALIKSCQKRDRSGQKRLYDLYADRFYRLALRYVKNEMEAEDIVIVSFNRILSLINSFEYRGEGSLEGWMRKIVINDALQWLRRNHNFNLTESIDLSRDETHLSALSALEAEDIEKMIATLPTGYRTVFNLSVIEGYDHKEISMMLEISENTSRTQLFKAKSILKKMLNQEGYHYGT